MHESWAVGVKVDGASRELVVRVSPAGRSDYEKTRREFEVLRVAYTRGVRCPEPIEVGRFESGEDYLYSADRFIAVEVPKSLERSILRAS